MVYAIMLVILCLVGLVFNESLSELGPIVLLAFLIAGVVLHGMLTAALLTIRLSGPHNDYLAVRGFRKRDMRALARMIALPSNLAFSLVVFTLAFALAPWPLGVLASGALFACLEAFCPWLVASRNHHPGRQKKKAVRKERSSFSEEAFAGTYRAFLSKDILQTRKTEVVGVSTIALLGLFIMLFSHAFDSLQAFALCLYISMLIPLLECNALLLSREIEAYHRYYVPLIHMKDGRFVTCKQPALALLAVAFCLVFTTFSCVLYGFTPQRLLVALALLAYFLLFSLAISWLHLTRIKKKKSFDSLYELFLLPIAIVPGLPLLYAWASWLKCQNKKRRCPSSPR